MAGSGEWADILPGREPPKIDITVAHPARIYDYWLGGKNNFTADREAAEATLAVNPYILPGVRANREFLAAAVRYLAGEAGITQFLDIGSGLPTENSTHEAAQSVAPGSRVVYVDNDPIVIAHARTLLTGEPGTTDYIHADLRDPAAIIREAARTLDFGKPVAIMLLMILMHVSDDDRPHELVARLLDAVPAGSYLVISETANDVDAEVIAASQEEYNQRVTDTQWASRTKQTFTRYFSGLEIIDPGLVTMGLWRPAPGAALPPRPIPAYCGVARKPAAG
jgi:S-adenosyl methyltransferase